MSSYQFEGKWEDQIQLPYLAGFLNTSGAYTGIVNKANTGTVNMIIMDEWSTDPDPMPAQLKAIHNLMDNQTAILNALLQHVYKDYERIRSIYQYEEPEKSTLTPDLDSAEDLKKLIGVGNIFIHNTVRNGIADIGFECGCTWDEEHGLGVKMNDCDLIHIGMADEAFSTDSPANYKQPDPPVKYTPHPKYGTLKPFQEQENKNYERYLIIQGYYDQLNAHLANGEVDLESKGKQLLETAIRREAYEAASDLIGYGVAPNVIWPDVVRLGISEKQLGFLIAKGLDVNSPDGAGNTAIMLKCTELAKFFDFRWQSKKYGHNREEEYNQKITQLKQEAQMLYEKGGDPGQQNRYEKDCYAYGRNLKDEEKREMEEFLSSLSRNKTEEIKGSRFQQWLDRFFSPPQ